MSLSCDFGQPANVALGPHTIQQPVERHVPEPHRIGLWDRTTTAWALSATRDRHRSPFSRRGQRPALCWTQPSHPRGWSSCTTRSSSRSTRSRRRCGASAGGRALRAAYGPRASVQAGRTGHQRGTRPDPRGRLEFFREHEIQWGSAGPGVVVEALLTESGPTDIPCGLIIKTVA